MAVERLARAKINLALHVTGRRADGYHLLDSLVAFADFGDLITVERAPGLSLTVTGPMGAGLSSGPDNLVVRAAQAMGGAGAAITLEKHLPVASGIGGGSADAAATLLALAELWGCDVPSGRAVLDLGADVPVCLVGHAARMRGIGEVITPLSLPPAYVVLVNHGQALSTADVFRTLDRRDNPPLPEPPLFADAQDLAAYLRTCRNDLQAPACALCPGLVSVIAALEAQSGCLLARMSGSGATCFGLFADKSPADAAAIALSGQGWWVKVSALVG